MSKFVTHKKGEWIIPEPSGYLFKCCNCSMIHKMDFEVARGLKDGGDHVAFRITKTWRGRGDRSNKSKMQGSKTKQVTRKTKIPRTPVAGASK